MPTPLAPSRRVALQLLASVLPARALGRDLGDAPPWRYLSGLEAAVLDAHHVYVVRGAAADNEGRALIEVARRLVVDVRALGDLGRDDVATAADVERYAGELAPDASTPHGFRATYAEGHRFAGRPLQGWYFPVYLGVEGGSRRGGSAMLTRQLSSMRADGPGYARPPAGYALRRHAPMAFYYNPESGFRPMSCYGWPQPMCNWTMGGTRPEYAMLSNGVSTQWRTVSAAEWIPETGRILRLQAVLRGERAGGAYVKPLANRPDDLLVGWVRGAGDVHIAFFDTVTTSREEFVYRVDEGVSLSLYARGFAQLQPQ